MTIWVLRYHTVNYTIFSNKTYYSQNLQNYKNGYIAIHGYLTLFICLFGMVFNTLNIIVLTRKSMLSPINTLLSALAVADLQILFVYMPHAIHLYLRPDLSDTERFSYSWMSFLLFIFVIYNINHNASTWFTVAVAAWRFIAICFPVSTQHWRGLPQARKLIVFVYIISIVFSIPFIASYSVVKGQNIKGEIVYAVNFNAKSPGQLRLQIIFVFLFFGILSKLIPAIMLLFFTGALMRLLCKANVRGERLKTKPESKRDFDKLTRLLVVLLLVYLVTNLPFGILSTLSGILGRDFIVDVFHSLLDTLEMLSLINSTVNFIIYWFMCKKFRETLVSLYLQVLNKK